MTIDVVKFAETLLRYQNKPVKLYPFQKDFLRSVNILTDRCAVKKGRAIGMSWCTAIAIVYAALTNPECRIAICSRTKEQSGWIFSHCCRFFRGSEILRNDVDEHRSKTDELRLLNGSLIVHRSCGWRAENLRGFHCEGNGSLIFDESAAISSVAIENMYPAAAGGAGIIHVSTPKAPIGEFHRVCTSDPDFKVIHLPSTISPRITKRDLDLWKRIYSPSRYRNEVMGEFAQGEDMVFDSDSIDRAIDDNLPLFDPDRAFTNYDRDKNYVYSLDISRIGADRWALMIGEVNEDANSLIVRAYHSWAGSRHEDSSMNTVITDNPDTIIRDLLDYSHRFYPLKIYADATSNEYFCHTLSNKYNLPVEEIVWSTQKKQRMIEHLASCLRAGKVKIPRDADITEQLLNFAYDKKKMEDDSERRIYLAGDDDYVSSLAMLAQSISWETHDEFVEYISLI